MGHYFLDAQYHTITSIYHTIFPPTCSLDKLYVQEVVTNLYIVTYYIKSVTTSWTDSISIILYPVNIVPWRHSLASLAWQILLSSILLFSVERERGRVGGTAPRRAWIGSPPTRQEGTPLRQAYKLYEKGYFSSLYNLIKLKKNTH